MRRVILAVVSTISGLVLLLGFKTASTSSTAPKPAAIAPSGTESSSSSANSGSSSIASGTKTVTGDSVDTRWGPVQVKITSAEAVDYPQNNQRDIEINSWAIPQLQQETVAASSANINMLSGATYTSEGYVQSLQSALDKL